MASEWGGNRMDLARRLLAEGCALPDDAVPSVVARSWARSLRIGRSIRDKVIFNPVAGTARKQLEEQHHAVLVRALPKLECLAAMLDQDEWAVSFIDGSGTVVSTLRPDYPRFRGLKMAFRPGVNLGESAAGTTGPACAMAEERTVVISGHEHFLDEAAQFTCSSAPIFDPQGGLLGVVNASRHYLGGPAGVAAAVEETSHHIEAGLIEAIPDSICLDVSLALANCVTGAGVLALSQDGVLVGSNRQARDLLCMERVLRAEFADLFGVRFGIVLDRLRTGTSGLLTLRNREGLLLCIRMHAGTDRPEAAIALPRREELPRCDLLPPELEPKVQGLLKAFRRDVPILLNGRTGTGKEELAKWLHAHGPRARGPFIAINCASIPAALIESELFGYEPGAFTGAAPKGMVGKLQQADGGTLFLDELGDMPYELQSRLLRVLQERKVCRVGGAHEYGTDFSLVSATHRDLRAMVQCGAFREDLFYRVLGLRLGLPDLNGRSDFLCVVDRILATIRLPNGNAPRLTAKALQILQDCDWPGNIRQLAQVLKVAAAVCPHGVIDVPHLAADLSDRGAAPPESPARALDAAEALVIREALARHRGNVSAAAKDLSIARATLYKKLRDYRIRPVR